MKILFLSILLLSSVFGHRLYILADDDGKLLHVKSYFNKSDTCQNCEVKVMNANNVVINSGKTDSNGTISFPFTSKKVNIEVTASMGHKNKISYESDNEITEEKNVTFMKMFLALGIILLMFLFLKVIKK
ncbi:hypothetical protein [Sulfurospirillum arcachonense]|uniref:hypothetical protein n=1 Tax=Sulfurospirillum arcachonense TaxID=57666 RepID=UPI000468BE55|nr:hypothetical protein [Sulfurospirillum arcachonense]